MKLYFKHGSAYTFTDSGWATIGKSGTIDLTLDLTAVNAADIREY
ncbi:hypothetical protein [Paenibacillus wynnii]|nr:hypothetical protein [Paenibacillus wynnii]